MCIMNKQSCAYRIIGRFAASVTALLHKYICAHLSDCLQYFKQKRPPPSTPKLPEDFVKKQRAYFADIDAFELPEEEVSESELV